MAFQLPHWQDFYEKAWAFRAKFLESQGAARVVPARELSLEEVRQIHETTDLEV